MLGSGDLGHLCQLFNPNEADGGTMIGLSAERTSDALIIGLHGKEGRSCCYDRNHYGCSSTRPKQLLHAYYRRVSAGQASNNLAASLAWLRLLSPAASPETRPNNAEVTGGKDTYGFKVKLDVGMDGSCPLLPV